MKVTTVGYWGGYPAKGEATTSYLFEYDGFNLLVDCGSGALAQLQNYIEPFELNAVIISHYHHDHVADVGVLQYALKIQGSLGNKRNPLPIYGHTYNMDGFHSLTSEGDTVGKEYNPEEELQIGPFRIEFLKTKHPVPCFAMKIQAGEKTVVFTADSSYQDEFIPFSINADLLICECNFYKGQNGEGPGHMTSEEAGFIAKEANVKHLLLSHLPHFGDINCLKEEAQELFKGNVELAYSGFTWNT
ncbi:MBL fold metallo-hydrolase [Priestia filamentosa]|uniref:MBL fold metallo-hydrolase n=1 Tax=Priestia filamentosa TaxID=1402861 RepID=UPI0002F01FAB|nr:MBL fold metallo-hydrolase [Priestia filamentosa]